MLHHRYQSRNVTIVITLLTIIFLMITTGAQFLNAARIFSLILGDKAYSIGMILCILVIILYSAAGALASSVGGVISYVFLYYCSSMQWYQKYLWNINPLIPALIITILLIVGVSLKTQDQKVPLGVYRVWFCEDYSEKYTRI